DVLGPLIGHGHVVARLGEEPAHHAADGARADDPDPHVDALRAPALRALAQGDRGGEDLAVPEIDHTRRLAGAPSPERGHEILEAPDAAVVDAEDHVAGAEPTALGPAAGHDAADQHALAALAIARHPEEGAARRPRAGGLARSPARRRRHLRV